MSTQTSQPLSEDEARAKRKLQVNTLCLHMGLNVFSLTVTMTQRISVLQACSGMSSTDAAAMLAFFSTGVGCTEFLLNPLAGKLSDAYGRRNFLVQSPLVSAVLKALVFMNPSKATMAMERCISGACTTIGGSTSVNAAISDLVSDPKERAAAITQLGTATGIGLILGPQLGTLAVGTSGNPARAYAIGSLVSALHLAISSTVLQEPLAPEKRKPMPAGAELVESLNPLGFVGLYQKTEALKKLVTVGALQFFCEGKSVADLNGYYHMNEAKMSDATRATYNSVWGVVMTVAGWIGPVLLTKFGMQGYTGIQNSATALGFALTGLTTLPAVIFAALPVHCFAMERGAAVRSLAVSAAEDAGMGKGEFAAKFANLRAVAVAVAPLLYARLYSAGVRMKLPGLPFFAGALIALLAQALFKSIPENQLKCK